MNTQSLLVDSFDDAAVDAGEFCEIPEHHEQAIVNRAVDLGKV